MENCVRRAAMVAVAIGFFGCSGSETGASSGGSSGGGSTGGTSGGSGGGTTTGFSGTTGADTWTNWASPDFFKLYCISCHTVGGEGDPTGSNLDWTSYSDVQMNTNDIRCGVAVAQDPSWNCPGSIVAKQFPIGNGPKPSDTERTRLVSWIDAGVAE